MPIPTNGSQEFPLHCCLPKYSGLENWWHPPILLLTTRGRDSNRHQTKHEADFINDPSFVVLFIINGTKLIIHLNGCRSCVYKEFNGMRQIENLITTNLFHSCCLLSLSNVKLEEKKFQNTGETSWIKRPKCLCGFEIGLLFHLVSLFIASSPLPRHSISSDNFSLAFKFEIIVVSIWGWRRPRHEGHMRLPEMSRDRWESKPKRKHSREPQYGV